MLPAWVTGVRLMSVWSGFGQGIERGGRRARQLDGTVMAGPKWEVEGLMGRYKGILDMERENIYCW